MPQNETGRAPLLVRLFNKPLALAGLEIQDRKIPDNISRSWKLINALLRPVLRLADKAKE